MNTGDSTGVATMLPVQDGTHVFVKGLPIGHERTADLDREAMISPHLPDCAPELLWQVKAGGWRLLGFDGNIATPWAGFTRDGGHLDQVAAVLRDLSVRPAPDVGLMTA